MKSGGGYKSNSFVAGFQMRMDLSSEHVAKYAPFGEYAHAITFLKTNILRIKQGRIGEEGKMRGEGVLIMSLKLNGVLHSHGPNHCKPGQMARVRWYGKD